MVDMTYHPLKNSSSREWTVIKVIRNNIFRRFCARSFTYIIFFNPHNILILPHNIPMEVQKNQVPPLTIHMSELVWLTDNITRTALGPA